MLYVNIYYGKGCFFDIPARYYASEPFATLSEAIEDAEDDSSEYQYTLTDSGKIDLTHQSEVLEGIYIRNAAASQAEDDRRETR